MLHDLNGGFKRWPDGAHCPTGAGAPDRDGGQVEHNIRSAANIPGEQPVGMLCFLDSSERVELLEI
jgi:hypothetical protein